MQSWSNNGQNGADETQHQWHNNYAFAGQNGQFDPHQPWSQPVSEQAAYSQLNPQDASPSNFFDSDQSHPFLSNTLHGSQQDQAGYHPSHDSLSMNQQFSQQSQDVMETDFSGIHPDIYGQHGKMNLDNAMAGIGQLSSHPHSTNFPYSMAPQNESSFEPSIQQFSQQHVMPQTSRQQSHTPVQQFDGISSAYTPGHNFSRPPQPSPVQNQQQYNQAAFSPPVNGQTPQPRPNEQLNFQQGHPQARQQPQPQQQPPKPQQQMQQNQPQPPPPQPQFAPKQPVVYPQTSQPLPGQNFQQSIHHQQPSHFINNATSPPTANTQYILSQPSTNQDTGALQPATNEPPPKKRKRVAKTEINTPTPTPEPTAAYVDSPVGSPAVKKIDDLDGLSAPTPTPEEAQLINQFTKRTKAAQAKFPAIKGLPHLVHEGTIKLPAPKSYDKLAPLVALPARSGRQMAPELGYSLPCEVQGRFTSQYRPSPDKGGLDERRMEAKVLLDDFDRSMKGLGKRRPKYTEYPHAFKEQLKSDEASKNKAEKKAKKELEEERGKPIRAATRPADPAEAAAWDAIGMVHIEQSVARTNALIATRVQQAGEYFIKLRSEMNRAKQELDQAIKDKKPEGVIARERQDFEQKKEILYRALDATIEHADDAVLDNLGGHQKLVLSLVNALIMCIKASDFSGKLPKIVLEMFTHFPMTKRIAETTNFETVRKRFADKGDSEVKELVSEITVKVKKLKASEPESTGYQGTSASSRAKAKPGMEPSAKRGRDEEAETRTVKKIAVESSGNALSRKLAQPKIQLQSASKTSAAKAAAASILPGKPRPVAKPAPKPETKADVKVISDDKIKAEAKPPRTETKPPVPRNGTTTAPTSSSASALSGIASLLDSINAPKAEAPVAPKETNGSETSESPEEKAKRLRKEARRKLRVSWKPETELVQIRIFQKEEAEDEGRESNMTRDAADDRSEGMVLKQRANVEEEEDDEDVPYQPWMGPVAIDFSRLPTDVRNKNFVTRGGNVTFTTDEQQRIADREQRELMAIYADPDDIPPSPKSPMPEATGTGQQKTQYLPDDSKFQEIQLRWRDEQQMGSDGALYTALQRIEAKNNPGTRLDSILGNLRGASEAPRTSPQHASHSQHHPALANDTLPLIAGRAVLEQVIAVLKSDKVKSWRDSNPITNDAWRAFHYSDMPTRLCGGAIEGVAKSLSGMPFPSNSPPEWILHDQEKVREWQMGRNKELASRQKRADEERARAEAEANALQAAAVGASSGQAPANPQDWAAYYAQQQQAYAPYMALLQQIQPQPQTTTAPAQQQPQIPDTQLQSILAAINQPSQASGQASTATSNVASYLNPNDPSYQQYMMLSQMAQGQQVPPPPPPPAAEREWDRDRAYSRDRDQDRGWDRERTYDRDRDDHHGGRGDRDGKDGRKKKPTLPPHKPANKALIGTKPCTFWQQGKCARGDKCTFRHD